MTLITVEPKTLEIACDKELLHRDTIYQARLEARTKELLAKSFCISWFKSILLEIPRNMSYEEAKEIVKDALWDHQYWIKKTRVLRHKAQVAQGPLLLDNDDYQLIKDNLEPL